jgi:exonuclease III
MNTLFKLCHLNVNSLTADLNLNRHIEAQYSKMDEIHSYLVVENSFDVITLSETWLDDTIPDDMIALDDYTIFRRDRNRHGGGVMAYVNYAIPCTHCSDLVLGSEMLCLNLKLHLTKCLVCICYRPPGQTADQINVFLEDLQQVVDYAIDLQFNSLIILGDLNDRCVHWNDRHHLSEMNTKLKDLITLNDLVQLIDEPTHFTDHSAYLLDVIVTDSFNSVVESGVLESVNNLHHLPVYAKFDFKTVTTSSYIRELWHYRNGDYDGLNNEILNYHWDPVFDEPDINNIVKDFQNILLTTAKKYIPVKKIKIRSKDKPWMNGQIKNLIRIRNRWCGRYNRTHFVEHRQIRDYYRSEVKKQITDAKDSYFERLREALSNPELQSKKYWKIVNVLFGNKLKKTIPTLIEGDEYFSTDCEKAALLSEYFASQSTLLPPPDNFHLPQFFYLTNSRLTHFEIHTDEVKSVLSKLNVSKASGPDGIGNYLLKHTANSIAEPLSKIFNLSLKKGIFPREWKFANQCPLPKIKQPTSKTNFGPISLLSIPSKITVEPHLPTTPILRPFRYYDHFFQSHLIFLSFQCSIMLNSFRNATTPQFRITTTQIGTKWLN